MTTIEDANFALKKVLDAGSQKNVIELANSITFFCDPASRTFFKAKFASSIVVIKFLNVLTKVVDCLKD